jgi:hypothetical protein
MNIIELKAENFKKLEAIEIIPDKNVNIISGRNAQGKSSVLDAIEYCLKGPNKDIPRPIKDGTDKAKITIDLGDITVTRTVTPSGNRLTVIAMDGTQYKSPQAVLDQLFSSVSFDPVRFMTLNEKEQIATLLKATGLTEKISDLNTKRANYYNERTMVNRELKELGVKIAPFKDKTFPEGDEISASEFFGEIREIDEYNKSVENKKLEMTNIGIAGKQLASLITHNQNTIVDLMSKIELLQDENKKHTEKLTCLREEWGKIAEEVENMPLRSTVEAEIKLANLEEHNRNIRAGKYFAELYQSFVSAEVNADDLSEKIALVDYEKKELLNKSSIGIPLTLGEEGVLFNGLPLSQCSSAEQLKISMAVAMALQPNLRVILIREGSLLDNAGLETIKAFATKSDYQLWIEKVDDTGTVGIVIEEGRIK